MRQDGTYTMYLIQHFSPKGFGQREGVWCYSSLDHFGTPKGFSASGDCWQQTGYHGTYREAEGMRGLFWIAKRNPGTQFRLVKVILSQLTEVIMCQSVAKIKK